MFILLSAFLFLTTAPGAVISLAEAQTVMPYDLTERFVGIENELRQLKTLLAREKQERKEEVQGFLRSQSSLSTKLDELRTELSLAQGGTEQFDHKVSELSRALNGLAIRLDACEKRTGESSVAPSDTPPQRLDRNLVIDQEAVSEHWKRLQRADEDAKATLAERQREKDQKALAEEQSWRAKIEANMADYLPGKRFDCIGGKLDPICVGKSRDTSTEVSSAISFRNFGPSTGIHGHYWRGLACRIYWADSLIKAIACE